VAERCVEAGKLGKKLSDRVEREIWAVVQRIGHRHDFGDGTVELVPSDAPLIQSSKTHYAVMAAGQTSDLARRKGDNPRPIREHVQRDKPSRRGR
jgi:hypothetical protein